MISENINQEEFAEYLGLSSSEYEVFRNTIHECLDIPYEHNRSRYDEEYGDDNRFFGQAVFINSQNLIRQRVTAYCTFVDVRMVNHSLCLFMPNGVCVHIYKLADIKDVDAYNPASGSQIKQMVVDENAAVQLSLLLEGNTLRKIESQPESDKDVRSNFRHVYLLHGGDVITGYETLTAGAPISDTKDGAQWAWICRIFGNGMPDHGTKLPVDGDNNPTSYSDIPEPEINLKPRDLEEKSNKKDS